MKIVDMHGASSNYNFFALGIKSFAILDNEKKVFQRMQDQVWSRNRHAVFSFITCILPFPLSQESDAEIDEEVDLLMSW